MQHLADDPPREDSRHDIPEKGVEGTESTTGIENTTINQEITTQPKISDISINKAESAVAVTERETSKTRIHVLQECQTVSYHLS